MTNLAQQGSSVNKLSRQAYREISVVTDLSKVVKSYPKITSMSDIIDNRCPKLSTHPLAHEYVTLSLLKWIPMLYNVTNSITKEQAEVAAEMIIEQWPGLRLNEIAYIIKWNCAQKNYNRIDVNIILRWFSDYADHSSQVIAHQRQQRYKEEIHDRSKAVPAPEVNEARDRLANKLKANRTTKREYDSKMFVDRMEAFEHNKKLLQGSLVLVLIMQHFGWMPKPDTV